MRALSDVSLHDAVLDEIVVAWHLGLCVVRLRLVGPDGGAPLDIEWGGVTEVRVERVAPWGPSGSVLEARSLPDGVDEIAMQSGDVIRVRAGRRDVREGRDAIERRQAWLIVDALADAGLLDRGELARAAEVAAVELQARRGTGDA